MELKEYEWNAGSRKLQEKIKLIATFLLTMRLHILQSYIFRNAESIGAKCSAEKETTGFLAITFKAGKSDDYRLEIEF